MKKRIAMLVACMMMFSSVASLPACATEKTVLTEEVVTVQPRDVNINEDFYIKIGESWMEVFNTAVFLGEDCDGFTTSITDVNGKYKYLIYYQGKCIHESAEYSTAKSFTTRNVDPDEYVTVYILNTGSKPLSGHVAISGIYSK